MSYWWHGNGGSSNGVFWGNAYAETWGQSLSQSIDESQLPGFGTHFGSHAQQAAARYEQMVQTSVQTAVEQRAAQAALEQGDTAAVAALVANNSHLGVGAGGQELYGAQALSALALHQQVQQARTIAHLSTPEPTASAMDGATNTRLLPDLTAQIGEPPIMPGHLPDVAPGSQEVFRQIIDTRSLDAQSADLGRQLTRQGLRQLGLGADEVEAYLREHPQATFRAQDGRGQALTDAALREQVASGVVENQMTAEYVRALQKWREGAEAETVNVSATRPATQQEGFGSFVEGAVVGGFSTNHTWSAIAGQTAIGLVPVAGQVADARDIAAAASDVYHGEEGAWPTLGIAMVAVIPGLDLLKAGSRAGKIITNNVVSELDPYVARNVGNIIAENPVAARAYGQMQANGTNVVLDFGPPEPNIFGLYERAPNQATIFMQNNGTAKEAVATMVHESSHAKRSSLGKQIDTQYDEYRAARREFLFVEGYRPSLEERHSLWELVQRVYSDRPLERNPFGGQQ